MRNLQHFNPEVTHERFVDAIVTAFRKEYGINEEVLWRIGRTNGSPNSSHLIHRPTQSKKTMLSRILITYGRA